ncbi:MAG: hypothetical protein E6Q97_05050 [Desulfurellales bacterium]|nr:MAG: hypothetical protein E6Q97_05050 [Desulfurellales bacterium]
MPCESCGHDDACSSCKNFNHWPIFDFRYLPEVQWGTTVIQHPEVHQWGDELAYLGEAAKEMIVAFFVAVAFGELRERLAIGAV